MRRPRETGLRRAALRAALAALVLSARAFAEPAPSSEAETAPIEEVLVTAPEPRYVAPTTRDGIGRIWAPVLIDGRGPFRLVLDTGATRSALIPRVAAQLGLETRPNGARVRGVTGTAVVPTVKVRSLELGELRVEDVTLPIVNDVFGGADGVLGGDGLSDKRIVIEFRRDRIDIARSRRQAAPDGYTVVPLDYVRARGLRTQVMVGPVPTIAIIDTGGQATVGNLALHAALSRRRGELDPFDDAIIGVTEDVQPAMRVRIPSIVAGEMIVRRAEIRFADLHIFEHWKLTARPALLIGMDVLGRLDTLILDYRREEMQVKMR
ncbi:MAG TPA: retropepsin-like aspartic protease [Steroidobacteraceae bacterium]|nr:retropepsin-like aspartic protease [Steroidobacteraceae bacterium]